MLLEIASFALAGYVAYTAYAGPAKPTTITGALNSVIDNGYQFRDVTYSDGLDLSHPDVKNNAYFMQRDSWVTKDRGINGIPRAYFQELPGTSTVTHLYRTSNLLL